MTFLGENIKKLGFGLMRLPQISGEIDVEQVKQMVDLFLEKGFSYFDTAYVYNDGRSEEAIKKALVDRHPRDSYQLATKLAAWFGPKTAQEAQDMFWTSLKRTGVEFFDFYLLHNLGVGRTESFEQFGIWDFLAGQKRAGRIRHLGFSMHATAARLEEVLARHPEMEFVQLQINYSDWESGIIQSRKCYEVARKYGKPVIVMEPVKGGALANLPEKVAGLFKQANPKASIPSWAIRYAASLEGVITVLSGMSDLEQMKDNLSYMEKFQPLSQDELAVVEKARAALAEIPQIPCTDCHYCLKGCPQHIAIAGTFKVMNDYLLYHDLDTARQIYGWETMGAGKASDCTECGQCETACPQSIPIIGELAKAAKVLES
ncbi:MAG: aldo/keto reductase [Candidatus Adiutrix sp.]|jgi:predicted aldo/keto reductase-like oxidoreductase|nr:aldo/keto reductase [Candidatus Adiutrix sp.]